MTEHVTIEHRYDATPDEVWELWTTPAGIESWWGPDGFAVVVQELDLRPGGALRYAMTAVDPGMVAFMEREGMPVTTALRCTYTEVEEPRRLAFTNLADFIPGVDPYPVATVVELHADGEGTRLVVTIDAMHDELWTGRARDGWTSQLGRLDTTLAATRS